MQTDEDSYPVHWIIDKSIKPGIVFGSTRLEQFEYLWCIRATFPQEFILQEHSDNALSCFKHHQAHPNLVSANTFIYKGYLVYPTGMHFGSVWSLQTVNP
jgi:hypothetical protein